VSVLVVVFALGLALSLLPWRPVAVCLAGIALIWGALRFLEVAVVFLPLMILMAPALLLGWACGLLIRRTIAERRVQ